MHYPEPVLIHTALVRMRDEPNSRNPYVGICSNMTSRCETPSRSVMKWLESMFVLWPKFTGDIEYPVPSASDWMSPSEDYSTNSLRLWENPNRLELLDFLIDKARMQANEPEAKPRFL